MTRRRNSFGRKAPVKGKAVAPRKTKKLRAEANAAMHAAFSSIARKLGDGE